MSTPSNETVIKIGFGTLVVLSITIIAWFINLQTDTNKYLQGRVDFVSANSVNVGRYERDHNELSARMQEIDKYIDAKFTKYEEVMHKRMSNMETRVDNKFRDTNDQLRMIQDTLNKLALSMGQLTTKNEKIACQEN